MKLLFGGLLAFLVLSVCVARIEKDVELSDLFTKMWNSDSNRMEPNTDWSVNTQGYLRNQPVGVDLARDSFFSYVNDRAFKTQPTYENFIKLLDNYNPLVGKNERMNAAQRGEISAFLNSVMSTRVFKLAHEYLVKKNLLPASNKLTKEKLEEIWFTLYGRGNAADTSGFEHVFVGEVKYKSVTGLHNWIQIYNEEKMGNLDYRGYFKKSCYGAPRIYSIALSWVGQSSKDYTSIFVGISPEFEFSVYTVAYLMSEKLNAGNRGKWTPIGVQIGPCFTLIQCHQMRGKYIGSCYFI